MESHTEDQLRLSTLTRTGEHLTTAVREVAALLAALHAGAVRGEEIAAHGGRDATRARWLVALDRIGRRRRTALGREVERLATEFLAGRKPLFDNRIADGRVLAGYGDLRADDVLCPPGEPVIRRAPANTGVDGLDDAAGLAADLERLGEPGAATLLLDTYVERAGDPAPYSLRHHFLGYRAVDRGELEAAARHVRASVIRLVLVGGLRASGKTTLSEALGRHLGATVLTARGGAAQPDLLRSAERLLGLGEPVVLDAPWMAPQQRMAATALATRTHSVLVPLRCWAPERTTSKRLADDEHGGTAGQGPERLNPWPEAYTVLTASSPADSLTQALAYVEQCR